MGAPSKHKIYTEFYQEQAVNYKKHLDILGLNPETTQSRYLYLREFFSYSLNPQTQRTKVCGFFL
jgi:integrase/recombinase XerD